MKRRANRKVDEAQLASLRQQLVQSEKMASLGTITAGIAHEINNPLSYLLNNTETILEYSRSIRKVLALYRELEIQASTPGHSQFLPVLRALSIAKEREGLEQIKNDFDTLVTECLDGIMRVREIVLGLKSFSRPDDGEEKEEDLNECIESTLKVLGNELKYKCEVVRELQPLPRVRCNAGQLVQVFSNLLLNAAYAIEGQGKITIRTEDLGGAVRLVFSDTGKGIRPEHLSKIFTPFFTTKPVGKGTGLGLSISYGIIQKHGGSIQVESKVGRGTVFTVVLPVQHAAQEAA